MGKDLPTLKFCASMPLCYKSILSIFSGRLLLFKKTALTVVKQDRFSVIIAMVLLFAYLYQKAIFFIEGTGLHSPLSMVCRNVATFLLR
jgi:hypothetical protein